MDALDGGLYSIVPQWDPHPPQTPFPNPLEFLNLGLATLPPHQLLVAMGDLAILCLTDNALPDWQCTAVLHVFLVSLAKHTLLGTMPIKWREVLLSVWNLKVRVFWMKGNNSRESQPNCTVGFGVGGGGGRYSWNCIPYWNRWEWKKIKSLNQTSLTHLTKPNQVSWKQWAPPKSTYLPPAHIVF